MKVTAVTSKAKSKQTKKNYGKAFQIVAIGASAGGLEAVTALLKNLRPDTGMCFIYVQHLSPDHKSLLPSLLSKSTKMKAQEVKNMVKLEPDNLYIIPHDKEMSVVDGHIKLTARTKERRVHLPIDTFFISLAQTHRESSIGIILSGSATDGTRGLLAIKAAGGLTFAQDDSAKFSSMPQSAINAGTVDFILSPAEIANELYRISKYDYVKNDIVKQGKENEIENTDPALKLVLNLLLKKTGVDFSHYKMPTIKRRILRRMLLNKITSIKKYAALATQKNDEINILYQDLLINVTSFFRDTEAHQYLKTTLFPKLLKSKKPNEKLRIWTPACATGEEAYSIAMTILEIQNNKPINIAIQIFATDLSTTAIAKARIGEYSKQDVELVSPKRLQRFYTKTGSKYRIAKVVRDMCVFAPHNILGDPPFSRVDFISCCNLLIYLDNAAQKKVLTTFHYALNENGYLMLGKSETIGNSRQLFTHINNKFKIYLRKKSSSGVLPNLLPRIQKDVESNKILPGNSIKKTGINHNTFDSDIDTLLLSQYVPAGVVINQSMEILQFRGETDQYLRHTTGNASLNILKMTSSEMAFELRRSISVAIKTKQRVRKTGIELNSGSLKRTISIEVIPLMIEWDEPLLLILFTKSEPAENNAEQTVKGKYNSLAKDRRIKKLEEELAAAHIEMHAFIQEQEAFTEELQSANEEVVSSNEELQSINEELETSKEEIESTNEELISTNQELQTRNELLNESYEFSEALIATIAESMIILDKELRIVSANKSFYKTFNTTETETAGILLYDLGNGQWNIPSLRKMLENIFIKSSQFENFKVTHEFPYIGEKIMLLNASRILQEKQQTPLILLAIQDITEQETSRNKVEESEHRYHEFVYSSPLIITILHGEEFIMDIANNAILEHLGKGRDIIGKPYLLSNPELEEQGIGEILRQVYRTGIPFQTFETPVYLVRNGKKVSLYYNYLVQPQRKVNGEIEGIAIMASEVTSQVELNLKVKKSENLYRELSKTLEEKVKERTTELEKANNSLTDKNEELLNMNMELQAFTYVASHDLQEPLRKMQTLISRIQEKENEALSDKGKDYFGRVKDSAERMQALIKDLLSFSRLNITERKFEKTDLNVIIEDVKKELKETIEEKKATVIVSDLCHVNIIPYQFRQLIYNLISNALKFSNPRIPSRITIKSSNIKYNKLNISTLPPLKEYCHITISDNGIGFEPAFSEKIFEVFQKLHGEDEYEGTGIGLAIVKKIVENHKGIIRATGEVGKGVTFEIYIPA